MIKNKLKFNEDFKLDWHDPDEATDGYQLKWIGKDYARLQTGTATETVIIPDIEHNKKEENITSENLFFTGDNLDVLKHLQNAYSNSIKMIYIDPPYNTGKEFTYCDKFEFSDEKLKDMLGLTDEEIKRLHSINGKSSHSAWLTFMYPRLRIAQKLLADDGVIFISIDDNEQANLKLLCDEIFSEDNVETLIWNKESEGASGTLKQISTTRRIHEYVLCLYKNYKMTQFKKVKEALKGKENEFQTANLAVNKDNENISHENYFTITNPSGDTFTRQWKWSREDIENLIKEDLIYWGSDGHKQPRLIIPTDDRRTTYLLSILNYGGTTVGRKDFEDILGPLIEFSYPKPIILLKKIIETSCNRGIILDFFAGSSTTAQAVIQLNAEDGGNRKFIMVQSPELTKDDSEAKKQGFNSIDEISRKRIELASKKIKEETNADIDYGFKHYYVKEVENKTISKIEEFDPEQTFIGSENMIREFDNEKSNGEDVILTTWLVDDGYKFDTKPEIKYICGYKAYYTDNSTLYLISSDWGTEQTKELLNLVGNNKFNLNTIIVYGYSFNFEAMKELEINIKQNLNNNISIEKRY